MPCIDQTPFASAMGVCSHAIQYCSISLWEREFLMASIAEGVEEDHLARSLPRVWRQPKSHLQAADELDWITKLSKVVVGKSSTAVTL